MTRFPSLMVEIHRLQIIAKNVSKIRFAEIREFLELSVQISRGVNESVVVGVKFRTVRFVVGGLYCKWHKHQVLNVFGWIHFNFAPIEL